jgi:hypothetical protein
MKPLALKPILSQLNEAHRELLWLFARMQFIVFGEVVDESVKNLETAVALEEERNPLTEETVFVILSNAYRHLNMAWNFRHASEERIWRCTPADSARWSRFPTSAVFSDFKPVPSQRKGTSNKSGGSGFNPNSLQAAFLQIAVRKLNILRYKISCALGDAAPEKVPRPKGLFPEVDAEPFMEKVFGRRMHRIYREIETSWTYRKWRSKQ